MQGHELKIAKLHIEEVKLALWAHGFRIRVECDLRKLMRRFGAHDQLFYSVFHPDAASPFDDAFWVNVLDSEGETVATHANAVFRTADFGDLVTSGRIWGAKGQGRRAGGLWQGPDSPIVGDIGHGGCMWVRPDYRGRGLVGPVHSLSMALAIWRLGIEFHTGFMYAKDISTGLYRAYGYERHQKCIDGFCPALDKSVTLYAVWMAGREMTADLVSREVSPRAFDLPADHLVGDSENLEKLAVRL